MVYLNEGKYLFMLSFTGGKCSMQTELSGENINITYKPDGTHIAVGNRVCSTVLFQVLRPLQICDCSNS